MKRITKKRIVQGVISAAAVNILRFYRPAAAWMDTIADLVGDGTGLPRWVAHIVLFTMASGIAFAMLQRGIGNRAADKAVWLVDVLLSGLRLVSGRRKQYYTAEERGTSEFRRDMTRSIRESRTILCLLIAGTTMVYDEEQFLLEALEKLRVQTLNSKKVRILLLDPSSAPWEERARQVMAKKPRFTSQQVYRAYCENALSQIKGVLPRAEVALYGPTPCWRLYIFDDHAFVSRYCGPPESPFREGHLTPVTAFDPDHPMYDWFYSEFRRHCPADWQQDLPLSPPISAREID
jgi:hypothetical protein